ncbi:hypothetical protein [Massilia sp. MS-15]|uniref:hypothetical protein n=1 Tax=Massilia sp. MS-15 TaxID=2878200 RepID=UPI001CD7EC55|nr:hypothetical protein [Massilia sp. MS-15]MCA1248886.1 hypothetical protein [Massilia sp. MS-15]
MEPSTVVIQSGTGSAAVPSTLSGIFGQQRARAAPPAPWACVRTARSGCTAWYWNTAMR